MPKGMTGHCTFQLRLDLNDEEVSTLKLEIKRKKLQEADEIIWDEALMIDKAVDKIIKDMSHNNKSFANKLIILRENLLKIRCQLHWQIASQCRTLIFLIKFCYCILQYQL